MLYYCCLHEQHIATGSSNGQAGGHSGNARPLGGLEVELRPAEVCQEGVRVHRDWGRGFACRDPGGNFPEDLSDLTLQVPDSGLARVVGHDLPDGLVREGHLLGPQAVSFELTRSQVIPSDIHLFIFGVSVDPDDLHAVKQGFRDGLDHVSGGDEQDFRKVQINPQVVVAKGVVLCGIKHLQQRARRIAPPVCTDFVNLVEHQHRVFRASVLQGPYDPPRQRANVGPAVSANLGLVVDAAKGDASKLPAERPGHRLAQRRLAYARRADQGQDGA